MRIEFHVTGADRKALVTAMGEILEARPKYLGMPTAAYKVDYFRIDKNGTVEFDDRADSGEIINLINRLAERGFAEEGQEAATDAPKKRWQMIRQKRILPHRAKTWGLRCRCRLSWQILITLRNCLKPKAAWSKRYSVSMSCWLKLMGIRFPFPGFQKRIAVRQQRKLWTMKNAFRCFLLRLEFIGEEYKADRKILLKNLKGSNAFKRGAKKEDNTDEISKQVRKKYPAETRVELRKMDDCQASPIGTKGIVTGVDDTASFMVEWDNGSHLHVIFGEDEIRRI